MFENEDGRVSGSIDRARVKELYDATTDKELKAYYRELLGDSDEGNAVDEAAKGKQPNDKATPAKKAASSGQKADDQGGGKS